jgi:hypothetical protein
MGMLTTIASGTAGGEIVPVFKFNAVQGRAYKVERTQGANGWESSDVLVPFPIKFVIDFPNMEVGPMAFILNRPDFHLVRYDELETGLADLPAPPTAEHKTGFRVRIYAKALGGQREWRGQQKCVMRVIDRLRDEYKAAPEAKADKLPVVEFVDVTPIKRPGKEAGIDMEPILRIVSWVDRPADLTAPAVAPVSRAEPPKPAAAPAPKAAPAAHVPPPPPPAPAAAAEDDAEFS